MKTSRHNRAQGIAAIMALLLSCLASAAAPAAAPVAAQASATNAFVALFSTTCMKYFSSPDKLRVAMKEGGMDPLSAVATKFFLNGKDGYAWAVPIDDQRYVVTLRSDGICAVFAQHAEIEAVRKDFTRLVSKATPPVEAHVLPGGTNNAVVQTTTYAWSKPAEETQLVFMLTTSTDPKAPAQAMATMALAAK